MDARYITGGGREKACDRLLGEEKGRLMTAS